MMFIRGLLSLSLFIASGAFACSDCIEIEPYIDSQTVMSKLDHYVKVLWSFNDRYRSICQQSFAAIEKVLDYCECNKTFNDHAICSIIEDMHKQRCIEPLFGAWQVFKTTPDVDNHMLFLREFSQIIFIVYQEIMPLAHQQGVLTPKGQTQ